MTSTEASSSFSQVWEPALISFIPSLINPGPMLAAGEELAEAARQALGVEMEFEDISVYVFTRRPIEHHQPRPGPILPKSILTGITGLKPSEYCTPSPHPTHQRSSIFSNTTLLLRRARPTTSPPPLSMILLANTHRSWSISSKCMRRSSSLSRSIRVRRGRPMASRTGGGIVWCSGCLVLECEP